jgi:hypothetical protein
MEPSLEAREALMKAEFASEWDKFMEEDWEPAIQRLNK